MLLGFFILLSFKPVTPGVAMEGKIPPAILEVLSAEFACRYKVVPLPLTDDILRVGVCQTGNEQLLSDIEFLTRKPFDAIAVPADEIAEKLQKIFFLNLCKNFLS
jgi:hypothetical protein